MDTLTSITTAISAVAGLATAIVNLITAHKCKPGPQHPHDDADGAVDANDPAS